MTHVSLPAFAGAMALRPRAYLRLAAGPGKGSSKGSSKGAGLHITCELPDGKASEAEIACNEVSCVAMSVCFNEGFEFEAKVDAALDTDHDVSKDVLVTVDHSGTIVTTATSKGQGKGKGEAADTGVINPRVERPALMLRCHTKLHVPRPTYINNYINTKYAYMKQQPPGLALRVREAAMVAMLLRRFEAARSSA